LATNPDSTGGGAVVVAEVDVVVVVGAAVVVGATDVVVAPAVVVVAAPFDEPHAGSTSTATSAMATAPKRRSRRVSTAPYATDPMQARPPVLRSVGLLAFLVAAAVGTGCGGTEHEPRAIASTTSTVTAVPTTTTTVPPTTTTTTTAPPTTVASTVPPTSPPAPPSTAAPLLVTRLNGVRNGGQVIAVAASGYGTTTASFTAYQRTTTGWQQVFGPWLAHIGRNGFAPTGEKREGDGRTPSGAYGLSFFFGVRANPGVKFEYRAIGGPWIVWGDDPSGPNYNRWIDTRSQAAGPSPEPMYVAGVYDYGAVIAYNTARTPGLGSAIFLHVSNGGTTAGCVSLPTDQLLAVLRWLDPGRSPRMVMGTTAAITS
jgi:L,D-peptidoglycan transpeptidase YkuD (ErfK/YbiS/YcfS/YnhG family)